MECLVELRGENLNYLRFFEKTAGEFLEIVCLTAEKRCE
jgi:hypothetical protein